MDKSDPIAEDALLDPRFRIAIERILQRLDEYPGLLMGPTEHMDVLALATILRGASAEFHPQKRRQYAVGLAGLLTSDPSTYEAVKETAMAVLQDVWEERPTLVPMPAKKKIDITDRPSTITEAKTHQSTIWRWSAIGLVLAALAGGIWILDRREQQPLPDLSTERTDRPLRETGEEGTGLALHAGPGAVELSKDEVQATAKDLIDGARVYNVSLWSIAERLARSAGGGRTAQHMYHQLQFHSGLPTRKPFNLTDRDLFVPLLRAWLHLKHPGRVAVDADITSTVPNADDFLGLGEPELIGAPWPDESYPASWQMAVAVMCLPILVLLGWFAGFRSRKRRHVESVLAASRGTVVCDVPTHRIDTKPLEHTRRHLGVAARDLIARTYIPTRRLDIDATLDATIRQGGLFTPKFAKQPVMPEYVFVILTHGPGDQDAERMSFVVEELADRLTPGSDASIGRPGSGAEDDPASRERQITRVYLEHDADRIFTGRDEIRSRISDLSFGTQGQRLVVMGTGDGLIDSVTLKPKPWTDALSGWSLRVLVTPVPRSEWGVRESALSGLFCAPVFSSTADGVAALAAYLRDREDAEDDPETYSSGTASPWRLEPTRWLIEAPFDEELEWAELNAELKQYLTPAGNGLQDSRGYEWLAALAVYPVLRWDLTCYIGLTLKSLSVRDGDCVLYDDHLAARLGVLPWFTKGRMPAWIRRRLIATLTPERRNQVIVAIRDLLLEQPSARNEQPNPVRLPVARRGTAAGVVAAAVVGGATSAEDNDLAANDAALLDLMDSVPNVLIVRRPKTWRQRFVGFFDGFTAEERLWSGLFIAYVAGAIWLVPKPWHGPTATGAWWPVLLLLIGCLALPLARVLWRRASAAVAP